jgi:hypothetical protein
MRSNRMKDVEFVDHAVKYAEGKVHTNGLENFWSLLKRSIYGTYVSVLPFHLFRSSATLTNRRSVSTTAKRMTATISGVFWLVVVDHPLIVLRCTRRRMVADYMNFWALSR